MSNLIDRLWSGSRDLPMGSDLLTEAATAIATLEQQVEELTKELDNVKQVEFPRRVQKVTDALKRKHEKELAALAEQNAKMRKVLLRLACLGNGDQYGNSIGNCIAQEALSLPNLASPVLNRVKAEALRSAADEFDAQGEYIGHGQQLRQMADDIEKGEALAAIKGGRVVKRTIVCCDVCGAVMTDMDRMEDHYGIDIVPELDGNRVAQKFSLFVHTSTKTEFGSSAKGSHFNSSHFCSSNCLARALNKMLKDAHIKLEVRPTLEIAIKEIDHAID